MDKVKMTIHRALSELKLIDAKIEKGIVEIRPTAFKQKDKKIDGYISEDDFVENTKSKYQSVTDLIARKIAIKSAIVKSNGETKVKVGSVEMTVSDAITFKSVINLKIKLVETLKSTHKAVVGTMNKNNELVQKNVDVLLQNTFGAERAKTITKEESENVSKPYLEGNIFTLVDPLKVDEKIQALEKEIGDFATDVDAVLSESNAVTFIEV